MIIESVTKWIKEHTPNYKCLKDGVWGDDNASMGIYGNGARAMAKEILKNPGRYGLEVISRVSKMADLEKQAIIDSITLHEGNLTKSAHHLGLGRGTLYRKVKLYNISIEELTVNQVREILDLKPIPGANDLIVEGGIGQIKVKDEL